MRKQDNRLIVNRRASHLFILIGIISFIFFGVICFGVVIESSWTESLDRTIIGIAQSNITETKTAAISVLTEIGNIRLIIVLTIALVIYLFVKRKYVLGLWFGTTIFFLVAIGTRIIKKIVNRTRPDFLPLIEKTTESFPSGHATSATIFYGMLVLVLILLMKKSWSKAVLGFAALALIGFILITRIYLGVHYPTDVIAGFFYGGAVIFFSTGIYYYIHDPLRKLLKKFRLEDESLPLSKGISKVEKELSKE